MEKIPPIQLTLFSDLERWIPTLPLVDAPTADGTYAANEEQHQHDLVFKTACRQFFGDLLELTRPDFARRVDLQSVEFLEQETFSDFPKGLRRIADIVAKLRSNDGEERLVMVQVEIEGKFRPAMDARAFFYYLYLRMKYGVPILLITIFLRGGRKALEMREFVDRAEGVEVCYYRYVAFCVECNLAEKFVKLPQPLAAGLAALMPSAWDPVEKKMRCLKAIQRADVDDARRYVLAKIVDLYVELNTAQVERFSAEVKKEGNEEVHDMVITWEDALADREAKGEAKGEVKGKTEAARDHILRILQRRLESVPAFVREKLDAIQNLERLEEILDQAIVVRSVDELVLEP